VATAAGAVVNAAVPAVDVNLLAFNAADTIGAAIESVIAQTWPALTLTVIDNGSTDATAAIVRQYQQKLPSIRLYSARRRLRHAENRGRCDSAGLCREGDGNSAPFA
jgi:glycosyltransferase involved in cell wall biosynthesis